MCREYESLSKTCETLKAKFTEYECQDTRCRENLKHARAKAKKLNGSLAAEQKKVWSVFLIAEHLTNWMNTFNNNLYFCIIDSGLV